MWGMSIISYVIEYFKFSPLGNENNASSHSFLSTSLQSSVDASQFSSEVMTTWAYGLRQGGCNFYEKLKSELEKRGHIQSAADPYAFCKKDTIFLCHLDCYVLLAQTIKLSDELFTSSQEVFIFTDEGVTDGHLGVEIETTNGELTTNQPQLIKRTLKLLGLTDASPVSTPVAKPSVGKKPKAKIEKNIPSNSGQW